MEGPPIMQPKMSNRRCDLISTCVEVEDPWRDGTDKIHKSMTLLLVVIKIGLLKKLLNQLQAQEY